MALGLPLATLSVHFQRVYRDVDFVALAVPTFSPYRVRRLRLWRLHRLQSHPKINKIKAIAHSSTAAASAALASPRPTHWAAAMAPASVTRQIQVLNCDP